MKKIFILLTIILLTSCANNTLDNNNQIIGNTDVVDNTNKDNVIVENDESLDENILLVYELIGKEKYYEAEKIITKNNLKDTGNLDIYKALLKIKLGDGKYEKALEYGLFIEKKSTDVEYSDLYDVLYLLGVVYGNLGDNDNAIKYSNKSLKIKPDQNYVIDFLEELNNPEEEVLLDEIK